ncbi:MAG: NUDIX domain-containing protein [Solirubrobacteraceae bacterium]|jgi:8-oxo-dGTP pyrophosphatase MutT (NUDIX family)
MPRSPRRDLYAVASMEIRPGIIARGPWELDQVAAHWSETHYEPPPDAVQAADAAIAALRERGSPSHDGLSGRLVALRASPTLLELDVQPIRWALRLNPTDASQSMAAMCVVRSSDGSWLVGQRAAWVASWPGRWALGAGGSVDAGESPAETLGRELAEEWSVQAERTTVEALLCLPNRVILFVGMAWLAQGATVTRDSEHDDHAWWPAEPDRWPAHADASVREIGALLAR